ncbi:MAG: sterol desaturase family protein [Bacteroidota bacterium]|nr:sterol desaturase family protein [Bacteroidota bacterium]
MKNFLQLFITEQRVITFILITIFFIIETVYPYLVKFESRTKHTVRNILVMIIFLICATPINYLSVLWFGYADKNKFGLLNIFESPEIVTIITGIFLIDLGDYFYHRLSHTSRWLWSYHRIHHSDNEMDVTTGYRFHPFEKVGLLITQIITSFLFGFGLASIALYYTIYLPLVILQHVNIKLPAWVEKGFGTFLSTPNFHRVHHANYQPYTDSNYGDMFCIWDRLFGTFKKVEPAQLKFGLENFTDDKKHTVWYMVSAPFRK